MILKTVRKVIFGPILAWINCAKLQKNLINNFREKPKTVTGGAKDGRVSSHLSQH